jgi:SAM-dependent methyltransferase
MLEDWRQAAKEYSQELGETGDFLRLSTINPFILSRLGKVSGRKILDLGCGEGYLSRLLISSGDWQYTGVDFCQELLDEAKSKNSPGDFFCADITRPLDILDKNFDVVMANMVAMDVAEIGGLYQNAFDKLKSSGLFFNILAHPAFSRPAARLFKTWKEKILRRDPFVRVDIYGPVGSQRSKILGLKKPTVIFFRPLAAYVQPGIDLGFELVELAELAPSSTAIEEYHYPKFWTKHPKVLALVFRKK